MAEEQLGQCDECASFARTSELAKCHIYAKRVHKEPAMGSGGDSVCVLVPGERTCGHSSHMRVQRADAACVAEGRAVFVWACSSQRRKLGEAEKPPMYEHLPCDLRGGGMRCSAGSYETSLPSQDNSRTAVGGTGEINNAQGDRRAGRMA